MKNPQVQPQTLRAGKAKTSVESDEQLVRATIDGDRAAFETLVRRHQRALVNHITRHTGRRDGALDLAQDVFLKVYLSLPSFDPKYRFTTWLYRIASNCAIDHLRKKKPNTCSLNPDPRDDGASEPERTLAGPGPTPDEVLRMREIQHRLEEAVASLPPEYRQLILLRHRQHCRYDEIARIARLPLGTVKNRIFRAREMLRQQLGDVLEAEVKE
ncbi:MAG: sigma-70 family RNA polymerase sigma factor [bacterium]|nr:sigma-70 family RNA polymerase sigma factor [bacterium]